MYTHASKTLNCMNGKPYSTEKSDLTVSHWYVLVTVPSAMLQQCLQPVLLLPQSTVIDGWSAVDEERKIQTWAPVEKNKLS